MDRLAELYLQEQDLPMALKEISKKHNSLVDEAFDMRSWMKAADERFQSIEDRLDLLAHEVAANGDAIAQLTLRFEAESAATIGRFQRLEERMDRMEGAIVQLTLDVTEVKLDLAGVKSDLAGVKLDVAQIKLDVAQIKNAILGIHAALHIV